MIRLQDKKIVVTGGAGFLGSWVVAALRAQGVSDIFVPRSQEYDLRDRKACQKAVAGQDVVIHIAADVGGIGLNKAHPGKLFYNNAIMGIELIEAARQADIEKMLLVGTACSYPKYTPVPFKEEDFWLGYPEETTGVYGLAKKMLWVQAHAYRQEYGFNTIYLVLVNLFGPHDNFDPEHGHVIPALIMRMLEAKRKRHKKFVVWGSGTATREFIYVEDAARGIVEAVKKYDGDEPVNLGTGREISIRDLVFLLKKIIGYEGEIVWDATKPDGQPRRVIDTARARSQFGFNAQTSLEEGLKKTITWYLTHQKKQGSADNKLEISH
jgi:GDP-L-fucose synthase